jgi:hypothetical protein
MRDNNHVFTVWEGFTAEADSLKPPVIASPPTIARRPSLRDRLAFLTLEGYLPLLAILFAMMMVAGYGSSQSVMATSLLAGVVMMLIFRPVLRRRYGTRLWALGLALPLLVVASSLLAGATRVIEHKVVSGNSHLEHAALAWQLALENLLSPPGLMVTVVFVLLAGAAVEWTHRRYPWVQLTRRLSPWSYLPLLCLLLAGFGLSCRLFTTSHLGQAEKSWQEEMAGLARSAPYGKLPVDSQIRVWRDLETDVRARLDAQATVHKDGSKGWSPEAIHEAVGELPVRRLAASPPTCLAELQAAAGYYSAMNSPSRSDHLEILLDLLEARTSMRPTQPTAGMAWFHEEYLLPRLAETKEPARLGSALAQLRTIRSNVDKPEQGLELRAYHLLCLDFTQLHSDLPLGWREGADLIRQDKFVTGWLYSANPMPQPLHVMGKDLFTSPTQLGAAYQRRVLLKK